MSVRSPGQETAHSAFVRAVLAEDDHGYPHGSVFIAVDEAMKDRRLIWDTLHEGRPTILVKDDGGEMLIAPVRLGLVRRVSDRMRRRMAVELAYRPQPLPAPSPASLHYSASLRAEIKRDSLFGDELAFACA